MQRELELTLPDGRPLQRVLDRVWREPWMTVARDTDLACMPARIGRRTLPDLHGVFSPARTRAPSTVNG